MYLGHNMHPYMTYLPRRLLTCSEKVRNVVKLLDVVARDYSTKGPRRGNEY